MTPLYLEGHLAWWGVSGSASIAAFELSRLMVVGGLDWVAGTRGGLFGTPGRMALAGKQARHQHGVPQRAASPPATGIDSGPTDGTHTHKSLPTSTPTMHRRRP